MTDERYKEIMENLGMPNSVSLLQALQQVANEVAQELGKRKCIPESQIIMIVDTCFHAYASNYRSEAKEMALNILAET